MEYTVGGEHEFGGDMTMDSRPSARIPASRLKSLILRTFRQLLFVDTIRFLVALVRYWVLAVVFQRMEVYESPTEGVSPNTISHNLRRHSSNNERGRSRFGGGRTLRSAFSGIRPHRLARIVSAVQAVYSDIERVRVLSVGPRTEAELLLLTAYGFSRRNIRGADLFSYSPWIDLADMHDLPYEPNTFDVAILSSVLQYSAEKERAASEVRRVVRDGGLIAINIHRREQALEETSRQVGYVPGSDKPIESADQLLGYFEGEVGTVYFRHDDPPKEPDTTTHIAVVFSIQKNPAGSIK